MNRPPFDTRHRGKIWSFPERAAQYTFAFGLLSLVALAALFLLSSEYWLRGLFHR